MSTQDKYSLKRHLLVEALSHSHLTNLVTLLTGNIQSVNSGISLGETLEVLRNPVTTEIPFSTPWIVQLEASPELAHAIERVQPEDYQASSLPDGWVSVNYTVPSYDY